MNKDKKPKPIKWKFGEPHCPHCDIELYYAWIPEIKKAPVKCQCGGIIKYK